MATLTYKHGAYGESVANSDRASTQSRFAPIYVGTAPAHTLQGGAATLNTPVVVTSFMDAVRKVGYSDDWAKYTLCEAIHAHFRINEIGPLVLINCLDIEAHKADAGEQSQSLTPINGRISITNAESIILSSVVVGTKILGTDYNIAYSHETQTILITQAIAGGLGTEALTITYETIDATGITESEIIGTSDGEGINTGLHAVKDVYQVTGLVPSMLLAPGFSDIPAVHDAMIEMSRNVNSHWDLVVWSDIPLVQGDSSRMTMEMASLWKEMNGYNNENEKTFFPMVETLDGRVYHISVRACANRQLIDAAVNGVPYQSASNTECADAKRLYFGDDTQRRVDDAIVNEKLNRHGITSMVFVGGRWVIWGPHSAKYGPENTDQAVIFDTTTQMLYYITNDFQHRRAVEIDKPMSVNRLKQIVSEEQARLDALITFGALTYGEAYVAATGNDIEDMHNGDFYIRYKVTTTPLAKSMTALVTWTDQGFATYFSEGA